MTRNKGAFPLERVSFDKDQKLILIYEEPDRSVQNTSRKVRVEGGDCPSLQLDHGRTQAVVKQAIWSYGKRIWLACLACLACLAYVAYGVCLAYGVILGTLYVLHTLGVVR